MRLGHCGETRTELVIACLVGMRLNLSRLSRALRKYNKFYVPRKGEIAEYLRLRRQYAVNRLLGRHIVFGKSVPRSGHHFLVSLLRDYFGDRLKYCSFYANHRETYCCGKTPCELAFLSNNKIFYQKSHDERLRDRKDVPGLYLIQTRSLLPSLCSHFDLSVKRGRLADSSAEFDRFGEAATEYYIAFHQRWVAPPASNRLIVQYENLASGTESTLEKVVRFVAGRRYVDEKRIAEVVTRAASAKKVVPRDPRRHRFFDLDQAIRWEKRVLDQCGPAAMPYRFVQLKNVERAGGQLV